MERSFVISKDKVFLNTVAKKVDKQLYDVKLLQLVYREDERGILLKDTTATTIRKFGEHYVVINPEIMIRGFHCHEILWDYFCIIQGRAKFILIDGRWESPTYGQYWEGVLSDRDPLLLVVPPGVYHGWKSLVPQTILSSTGSELYDSRNPDEIRVPYTSFGINWDVVIK